MANAEEYRKLADNLETLVSPDTPENSVTTADATAWIDAAQAVVRQAASDRAELDRLHSWDGLMELLDEHWPEEFLPTLPDDDKRDPGPRIVALMRLLDHIRAEALSDAERLARVLALLHMPALRDALILLAERDSLRPDWHADDLDALLDEQEGGE